MDQCGLDPWHRTYTWLTLGFLGRLHSGRFYPRSYYMEGYRLLYNISRSIVLGNKPEILFRGQLSCRGPLVCPILFPSQGSL